MRVTPEVHLVGGGDSGFGLTDPFDCHVYLLDGGSEAALVDAGIGTGVDRILANARAALPPSTPIRYVLLTHAHPDHSGGAAAVRDRLADVRVLASREVAAWVRTGDEEAMSVETGKRSEFYPADFRFTACPVEGELSDRDRVVVGELSVEAIETPGHADGHLSYVVELDGAVAAFTGDLVFDGGLISLANNWDCRIPDYSASVAKLARREFDLFLPGHHGISLRDGRRHVETAHRLFASGFVPRSVV